MNIGNLKKSTVGALLLLAIAMSFVTGFAGRTWLARFGADLPSADYLARLIQEKEIRAGTAAVGESFAVATGPIDSEVEGFFMLDFITGDLQCVVLNYRTARFGGVFRTNVLEPLGVDPSKKPKYLLATGMINFPRGASPARPANSVVYVLETTTGNFAAFGLPWRRELAATGRNQAAGLILLDGGTARTTPLREP